MIQKIIKPIQWLIVYVVLCTLYCIPQITTAQSFDNFSTEIQNMGINVEEFSQRQSISRYELARLLNAVECQDCIQSPNWMMERYTNPFWSDFITQPGKDFGDITFQGWSYQGNNYYYCVAYVGDNNYMRWYPQDTSPICAGLFCGTRNTNYAEFIQVIINVLAKYIYQEYRADRGIIQSRMQGLAINSYPDRYLDDNDRITIQEAADACPQWSCPIQSAAAFKTYIKYCMFNLNACDMRTFWQIAQAYWPVSELNILYNQEIIDVQRARNIDIYANIDGQTALDIFYKLYTNIQCSFDNDYDCDGIVNAEDNCPYDYNPSQKDTAKNGIGDVCDEDIDGDGIKNPRWIVDETWRINVRLLPQNQDNCLFTPNTDQQDSNNDDIWDACIPGQDALAMYIAIQTIGDQAPLTVTIDAVTRWSVIGDIQRDMGDGSTKKGQSITHTYNNPWLYVVHAYAQWTKNNAVAKTTIIVGQSNTQQRGIQIQADTNNGSIGSDINFSANTIGDIEYIQRDFGDNIRINRQPGQSITRQYSQAGIYTVTARAFKGNTLLAIARTTVHIGGIQWSEIVSQNGLRLQVNTTVRFQTQINANTAIKSIQRDFGDGTQINNSNTAITHTYTTMWPRVITQTITFQDNTQTRNYITVYIIDPIYGQSFSKNFAPNNLITVPWQTLQYINTPVWDNIQANTFIQRYTPTVSQTYQGNNTILSHRYDSPWVYFPSNTQYINQCLFLESQATVVIEQEDLCIDIMRSWRANQYCDMDDDNIPDICDDDIDGDWVQNLIGLILFDNDNCSISADNINYDLLQDHIQWVCLLDNCPFTTNSTQEDRDRSGIGDICEESLSTILQTYTDNIDISNAIKDSDGDGIDDTQDGCPTIHWWFWTISGCPAIGAELACPSHIVYPGLLWTQQEDIDIPRCPLYTRLCNDNLCHETCEDYGGDRTDNNNGICDPLESCNNPDCMDQQDRCQNGLKCGDYNGNNVCIVDPIPTTPQIPTNPIPPTGDCVDPTTCIKIPPITSTTCNQCPCQFADFASDLIIGDKIRATLRDATQNTLYRYATPTIVNE